MDNNTMDSTKLEQNQNQMNNEIQKSQELVQPNDTIETSEDGPIGKKLKLNDSTSLETKVFTISEEQRANFDKIININNEERCGITCYVYPERVGFEGIIKNRYSDFLVNEVDTNGQVVHLTEIASNENSKQPQPEAQQEQKEENGESIQEKKPEEVVAKSEEVVAKPEDEIDEAEYEGLIELFNSKDGSQCLNEEEKEKFLNDLKSLLVTKDKSVVKSKTLSDKELRTKIHIYVKQHFNGSFYTTTNTDDSSINFVHKNKNTGDNRSNRDRNNGKSKRDSKSEKSNQSDYLHFSLYKENRETNDLIGYIARTIRVEAKKFTFAGTKDRRGVTVQRISAFKVNQHKLAGVNSAVKSAALGNFKYETSPLRLGDHKGNQFTLVIRNVTLKSTDQQSQSPDSIIGQIEENLNLFKQNALAINYFGMQRFGTTTIPTFVIGTALLNSDWKRAVELILDPREGQHHSEVEARNKWRTSPTEALNLFPKWCVAERALLTFFNRSDNGMTNYCGALSALPRNLRSMYLHSYQSYIWNHMVNYRIQSHGPNPVIGDLVQPDTLKDPILITEESQLSLYTLKDVVLPLPGHQVQYPKVPGLYEAYVEKMAGDNLDPSNMTRNQRDYSLPGDYRPIVILAKNFDYEIFKYNDETIPLVLTDLDRINQYSDPQSIPDGEKVAIKMTFELNASGYATMILREIMKTRTESGFQASIVKTNAVKDE